MKKRWLAAQVQAGKADKEIAAALGMSTEAVGYWRRKFGIAPRPASERTRKSLRERYPGGRRGPLAANWRGGRRSTTGLKPGGYIKIYMPDHPHTTDGYVYEHRVVMEQKLGRLLEPGEVVDHIDCDRSNNAPNNLRLHATRSKHVKDHYGARRELLAALALLARFVAGHACTGQACDLCSESRTLIVNNGREVA